MGCSSFTCQANYCSRDPIYASLYVKNSAYPQLSPPVNISCTVVSPGPRNSPGVVSVLNAPGLLIIPAFNLAIITQHSPLRYGSNIITLTLIPNFHVTKRSSITVTGLNGSLSADSRCLNISVMHQSCNKPNLLVLTAQNDDLLLYDSYVIQFVLRNGEEQPSVTVKIGALIDSPSVPYLFGNSSDYPELLKETETRFAHVLRPRLH